VFLDSVGLTHLDSHPGSNVSFRYVVADAKAAVAASNRVFILKGIGGEASKKWRISTANGTERDERRGKEDTWTKPRLNLAHPPRC
jgi:hypothetical protein